MNIFASIYQSRYLSTVDYLIRQYPMKKAYIAVRDFVLRYPAILASYFIYSYYFISTMDFYVKFKHRHFGAKDAFQHFDTLLWMWILSYALVKVIDLRERLHSREKALLEQQHHIELKETQIQTLHEVIMTLKHEINNPLAIILGYTRLLKKKIADPESMKKIDEIEVASQRINHALKEFSTAQVYEVSESPVGNLVELAPFGTDKKQ